MPETTAEPAALVRARGLTVRFVSRDASVTAVNGVDLDLLPGEVLSILGESGSGKSVTLRAMMALHPPRQTALGGELLVCGHDMLAAAEDAVADIRGRLVSMIFQEPMTALDPVFTIGHQITETIIRHEAVSRRDAERRALDLLEMVQVPSLQRVLAAYPHELSGGLRQRAMIAMALSCRPRLLLADEPTTALDATVQIQILLLLRRLQQELGMGIIFVTHDIGVASEIADRIEVMYAGRIVEGGSVRDILRTPAHPYTRGLLGAMAHGRRRGERLPSIPGAPPDPRSVPPGCSFAPRCSEAEAACLDHVPEARLSAPNRLVRCIHAGAAQLSH
ncbi:MAG: ABC transporter ATP-binding protein [Alphaproteobacteria bacterium]|nr:ABC transporter ATP-binding protein [Alphaproteobacteria bacterium]